jgi:rod shape-determining protein MreB and related proteins
MCGGGALLRGLDLLIKEETSLPVFVAENPLESVVRGAGRILENISVNEKLVLRAK